MDNDHQQLTPETAARLEIVRHEQRQDWQKRMATVFGWNRKKAPDCILSLGNNCYQVPGHDPRGLDDCEDAVLKSFIATPAMSRPTLEVLSGTKRGGQVLHRIAERYPEFAPFIKFPEGKNTGGYVVKVKSS